jgi:hypothetical protein
VDRAPFLQILQLRQFTLAPADHAGGLPSHIFTSLGAAQETRLATAAAQQPMPLMRRSLEESAALGAGLLKAFEREVADTQLLLVPQVQILC